MKNKKSCGKYEIPVDLLKICDGCVSTQLSELFTEFLRKEQIYEMWCESKIILLFKKGKKKMRLKAMGLQV